MTNSITYDIDWPSKLNPPLKVADVSSIARQYNTTHDFATVCGACLDKRHYLHFVALSQQ